MCNHHWLIELRPDPADPNTWSDLDRVDMSGGRTVSAEEVQRGRLAAREIAYLHCLGDPDQASAITITHYDCSGEGADTHAPFAVALPDPDPSRLAAQIIAARQGLWHYARPGLWRTVTRHDEHGEVAMSAPALADRGMVARRTLGSL